MLDISQGRIEAWNNIEALPIYEPGLKEVVMSCFDRNNQNLFFSNDIMKHVNEADCVFVRYCQRCIACSCSAQVPGGAWAPAWVARLHVTSFLSFLVE